MSETFFRTIEIDGRSVNANKRTVELSFSSELPVERHFGNEVLDHSPGAVDLSRLNSGGALLVDHNPGDQIGVVEKAIIGDDRKGRATVRFGNSARANEIFQDVKDGIRKLVSVGYRINKTVREKAANGLDQIRATSWTPHEISLVSVPADTSVGIGRNLPPKTESKSVMSEENQNSLVYVRREIDAMVERLESKIPGIREVADRHILEGKGLEEFRNIALSMLPTAQPIRQSMPIDVKPYDLQRYSISRALHAMASGRALDGLEGELSREVEKRSGQSAAGFFVPDQALVGKRNYVAGTATLGGNLVETSNLGSEFITLLRNRARCIELGARVVDLPNPVTIPRQSGSGTVNWLGETTASTLTAMNFTQMTLTPHHVGAFQQYSKQLLMTGNPSIDALIRDDLLQGLALAIDRAALHGAGGSEPIGIANTSGVNTIALAASGLALGNATAYPAMVSLESAISAANADEGSLGFLIRAGHRGALRLAQRFSGTDSPVYMDGKILGYRASVTQQIATNLTTGTATTICSCIFFGDWNQLIISNFGATDLVVDPYTLSVNGVVRVIARKMCDVGVRHPESFAILGGILTT